MKEIKRGKNGYIKQLFAICSFMLGELNIEDNVEDSIKYSGILKRLIRSSLY
jgi:hypothetical protein